MPKFSMGLRGVKCCLCGKTIRGFGNNPYPLDKREGVRCCDECNNKVIIARVYQSMSKKERSICQSSK